MVSYKWFFSLLAGLLLSKVLLAGDLTEDSLIVAGRAAPADCQRPDPDAPVFQKAPTLPLSSREHSYLSADYATSTKSGLTHLQGDVEILRNGLRVRSDQARYQQTTGQFTATGNVHVDTSSLSMDADEAEFSTADENNTSQFHNTTFVLPADNEAHSVAEAETATVSKTLHRVTPHRGKTLKGRAESILSDGHDSFLQNTQITSCLLADPDWLLSAAEIELDHDDEYGKARDTVIRFKNVPFLYTPYIEFPISERRRSGFLFPEVGSSSSRGVEIAIPWYWNIAPNMDAIITPRNMVRRGLQLEAETRYLTESSSGSLDGVYLHNDKQTSQERYQYRYKQKTAVTDKSLFKLDIQDVSDKEYFNDFSNNLGLTSLTHLNRQADLTYTATEWKVQAKAQKLKTIDTDKALSSRPYARLPQLTIEGETALNQQGLRFNFEAEGVNFAHEDKNKDAGTRLILEPRLHWPISGAAWFIDPSVKYHYTGYRVGPENASKQSLPSRNLLVSSVDSGLFFEREMQNGLLHTIEPRLFYLHVPFREQDFYPRFDTSEPSFSVSQLFRDNRFNGGDRFGDANQLTLSLTSRIINPLSGEENFRASVGQIIYFDDRQVTLTGKPETDKVSDVITEFSSQWGAWKGNIDLQWDTRNHELSREKYFLQYKSDDRHIFNIGYRLRLKNNLPSKELESDRKDLQQIDASMVLPITDRISAYARWNYSKKDHLDIDSIGGLSYNSCCWSVQLLVQRRLLQSDVTDTEKLYDNSFYLQFVLKGLGSVSGSKARNTLEQSILGYTDTLQ